MERANVTITFEIAIERLSKNPAAFATVDRIQALAA